MGSIIAVSLSIATAHAFTIDTFLDSAKLGSLELPSSGDADELAFIRNATGDNTLTLDFKIDTPDPNLMLSPMDPILGISMLLRQPRFSSAEIWSTQ